MVGFHINSLPSKHCSHATEGNGLWTGPLHCYYWWMDLKLCFQEIQYTKRSTDIYGYFWRLNSRFINSKLRIETSNCVFSPQSWNRLPSTIKFSTTSIVPDYNGTIPSSLHYLHHLLAHTTISSSAWSFAIFTSCQYLTSVYKWHYLKTFTVTYVTENNSVI